MTTSGRGMLLVGVVLVSTSTAQKNADGSAQAQRVEPDHVWTEIQSLARASDYSLVVPRLSSLLKEHRDWYVAQPIPWQNQVRHKVAQWVEGALPALDRGSDESAKVRAWLRGRLTGLVLDYVTATAREQSALELMMSDPKFLASPGTVAANATRFSYYLWKRHGLSGTDCLKAFRSMIEDAVCRSASESSARTLWSAYLATKRLPTLPAEHALSRVPLERRNELREFLSATVRTIVLAELAKRASEIQALPEMRTALDEVFDALPREIDYWTKNLRAPANERDVLLPLVRPTETAFAAARGMKLLAAASSPTKDNASWLRACDAYLFLRVIEASEES